jgi:hypothetical protein
MKQHLSAKMAASATLHCLIGCAVGEMIGVTIGTHVGIGIANTLLLATVLSFVSGYTFSTLPIIRRGLKFWPALKLVVIADTVSILTMTIVDNISMVTIPGAFEKDLTHPVYWISRIISLAAAFIIAWPVNYYLLSKGKGHALTHKYMHDDHEANHHSSAK